MINQEVTLPFNRNRQFLMISQAGAPPFGQEYGFLPIS